MAIDIPFNLCLLATDKSTLYGLLPVQSMNIYYINDEFHPQGLYSSQIFGDIGSPARQIRHSYIDMRIEVMHPKVFMELTRLKNLYRGIMDGSAYAIWDTKINDFVKSDIIDGQTGYSFFMEHFHDVLFASNESDIRELRINFLNKVHEKCMYQYLIVIPAGLRDIEINEDKRVVEDEINALYRKAIRISNTISIHGSNNNSVLNTVRWNLQNTFNEIYLYIESILSGKKGFLLSKWAARNIHGGTRNVITAMDPAPKVLGTSDAITINDSSCGLHQYLKGTSELSIYNIKHGPMENIINNITNSINVVDKHTLRLKQIYPSLFIKDTWGSEQGIEKLLSGFEKLEARHKPIIIDGDYAALIYKDSNYFRVFYDIDDLPSNLSKHNVTPLTWGEMFYISVYEQSKKVACYITRYPITGTGSIYPSFIYLQTTVKTNNLQRLDDNWKPVEHEDNAIKMPITGEPWIDSMSVHSSKTEGLGADFDGDKCSLTIVTSKEAVKEAVDYLNSKEAYINTSEGLRYGINNHVITLVLNSFTRGLQ